MIHPRSPYDTEAGICHFPRMLDKIRLGMNGKLDAGYRPRLGQGMDGLLCQFLGVQYDKVKMEVVEGKTDADILAWCLNQGTQRSEYDFMLLTSF